MIKLTCVKRETLEEIIEEIGSLAIVGCELNETSFEDTDMIPFYDIKLDSSCVFVVFHGDSLTIIKNDRSIAIKNTKFYQCLIQ